MANSKQAIKRSKQNDKHRQRNQSRRASMRTSIKSFLKAIQDGDHDAAKGAYRQATASIDGTVAKGLQHKNRAARLKSRLNARLKQLASTA